MGGTLTASAARVAGAIGLVACAAVVTSAIGGGSLFGGLSGLFGSSRGPALEVARAGSPRADIVAAPTAAERRAASRAAAAVRRPSRALPRQQHRRTATAPPSGPVAPSPGPAPLPPVPPSVPPGPAPPAPGGGQVAGTLGGAVKQVSERAPRPVQQLAQPVNDVVDQVVRTCQALPVCP